MSTHGMSSNRASQVKRVGHLREQIFSNQFSSGTMSSINTNVNFSGSSADCLINREEFQYIIDELGVSNGTTSVKGGSTYQFHLGKIPELIDYDSLRIFSSTSETNPLKSETCFKSDISETQQESVLRRKDFWWKYLGKGELLAIDAHNYWNIFSMKEVINLLVDSEIVKWRFRPTGRIKGDLYFKNGSKRTGITFEHRFEKNQSVLGAHGGKTGIQTFLPWLIDHIENMIKVENMIV